MAKWERYIVYPLLFVALFFGVARETRVLQAAESIVEEIRARRVVVVDEAGREQVVIRGAAQEGVDGGQIEVFDKEGKKQMALGATKIGGDLQVFDERGKREVWLWASSLFGGFLGLYGPNSSCVINQDSFVPQKDEWGSLYLTAYLNTGGWALTQKLNRTSFTVVPSTADGLKLEAEVNTTCQPTWNFHLGQGRFSVSDREVRAAYEEAGNYVFENYIKPAFSQVSRNEVKITFFIQGYEVGTWHNGVMKLKGE